MPLIHRVIVRLMADYRYQKLNTRVCIYVGMIFGCVCTHTRVSRSLRSSLESAFHPFLSEPWRFFKIARRALLTNCAIKSVISSYLCLLLLRNETFLIWIQGDFLRCKTTPSLNCTCEPLAHIISSFAENAPTLDFIFLFLFFSHLRRSESPVEGLEKGK